ncbi:MAG TPA: hypothetical protein IAB22_03555 [Candidatus Merdivicinus intestinavium]|nr:hypothetical protein [Candidatus Merdivicinus intestinavium]
MKRFTLLLLAGLLTASLSACGPFTEIGAESSAQSSQAETAPDRAGTPEEDSSSPQPESSEAGTESLIGAPIPESAAQPESYFDDAVFIGDSLTTGLSLYGLLPEEQVLADTGINPQTILTRECISQDGTDKTVLDAAAALSPAKIYIMLGANGVAFLNFEDIVDWYGQLIDGLREEHPDSEIYVQSVLPVTREREDDTLNNARITELNGLLQEMAADKGVFYLSVNEAIADEEGFLPTDLSADGMHFGTTVYEEWLQYLLCHTAEGALA